MLVISGHSQLLTACGSNALSLKEFFLAAEAANQLLFRSISIIVRAFQDMPGSAMPITFINGIKMFAENTMDPLIIAVVGGDVFKKTFNIPIEKTAMDIFASTFRMPGFMRLFVVIGNPMAWADFVYHFIVDLIYRIIRAVHAPPESRVRPEAIFYLTMYDFKQQFDQIVSASTHRACAGLSLALGYTNPWARIIRTQCDAWASVPSGMLQFVNVFLVDIPAAKCLCKDAQVRVCLLITPACGVVRWSPRGAITTCSLCIDDAWVKHLDLVSQLHEFILDLMAHAIYLFPENGIGKQA